MANVYDLAYFAGGLLSAPWWLLAPRARRKVFTALSQRMGHIPRRNPARRAVLLHAVSMGEVNATRMLMPLLRRDHPEVDFVLSTTTDTGFERAQELYGQTPGVSVVRFPLDFSGAIARFLDAVRPSLVVLMELEVWPNFILQCRKRDVPVLLINGRITTSARRGYARIAPVTQRMFRRLAGVCAQDMVFAKRFIELGVPQGRVLVTGTMKFDTAEVSDRVRGARPMAEELGIQSGVEQLWVCGSTGPGEEEIILRVYRKLLARFARLRLAIVPRHPERFDEVAGLIEEHRFRVVRRSVDQLAPRNLPIPPVILGDTMGELRKFYAIANVALVGRSLVDLGPRQRGSDMIEPAALGKPVIVGPYTDNFADAMLKFTTTDAIMVVPGEEALEEAMAVLLSTPEEAVAMGRRAVAVVLREKGATGRNVAIISGLLERHIGDEEGFLTPNGEGLGKPVRPETPMQPVQ